MAICYPPPNKIEDRSERAVALAINSITDSSWVLIHGVRGIESLPGRPLRAWEADFIAVHPDHGLIVVEVKGGGISLVNNTWKQNGRRLKRTPVDQALDNLGAVRRRVKEIIKEQPDETVVPVGTFALAFPDCSWSGSVPNGMTREQIWSKEDLAFDTRSEALTVHAQRSLRARWENVTHASLSIPPIPPAVLEVIIDDLVRSAEASRDVVSILDETLFALEDHSGHKLRATDDQLQAMLLFQAASRACVVGPPGTGKTLLARRLASRAAEEGRRVLLLAPPGRMVARLATEYAEAANVTVATTDQLAAQLAPLVAGEPPPTPQSPSVQERYAYDRRLQSFVREALGSNRGPTYDSLIIDEAQSMPDGLIEVLTTLTDDSPAPEVYVFADPGQRVEAGAWTPPSGFIVQPLVENCRNTQPISWLFSVAGNASPTTANLTGPNPRLHILPTPATVGDSSRRQGLGLDLISKSTDVIEGLVNEGVAISQLVVLTHGWERELLAGYLHETWVELDVEDFYNFRGEEAPVVVAVLPRGVPRARYVALSRAKALLVVVAYSSAFDDVQEDLLRDAVRILAEHASGALDPRRAETSPAAWALACGFDGSGTLSSMY